MQYIQLCGDYKLKYYDFQTFCIDEVIDSHFFPDDWMDTQVPEDVRTVLRRYGYLDGYYFGKDLNRERWIEEKDWVYYRSFYAHKEWEGQQCMLCFEGIDTIARVWVNGTQVGMCVNMFRQYNFDVTDLLRYGEKNTLVIQVISPIGFTLGTSREGIYPQDDTTRMLLRKSQMNWGWDFCGHCITTGIWKPVGLKIRKDAVLCDVRLTTTAANEQLGRLHLACAVDRLPGDQNTYTLEIQLSAKGSPVYSRALSEEDAASFDFSLEKPHLWWPKPYGTPFLYDVCVRLLKNGMPSDEKKFRFGLRTVQLVQEKDDYGHSFLLSINGRKLFIRGANWVPLNCVYAEITQEQYDFYMGRILDSNLSMLRIWGGGIYESEYFLDLCDENGIMIFQDMMLACGIFPQNEEFLRQVQEETSEVVGKNYNRTCIVMWSADNELDEAYRWYDMLEQFPTNRVNREAVRRGVEENDQSRPFLVSSPCSPFAEDQGGSDPNSDNQGDMHVYLTRFKKDSEYYYKKVLTLTPRFMSEYGFSSLPWESSYYRFNYKKESLDLSRNPWLGELDWLDKIGKSGDTSKTIYYSQFTHAQALKYWIEYLRSLKWHCGGSLYWKFNDPIAPNRENMLFPTLMSCIDFFRLPKLAYYYARRAYEDRILAFREDLAGNIAVYGCSECLESVPGTLQVQLKDYDGTVLWAQQKECVIKSDQSVKLAEVAKEQLLGIDTTRCYLTADFFGQRIRLHNLFHLTEIGAWDMVKMPQAHLRASICAVDENSFDIKISTDAFVQDVTVEILNESVYYTDNSFCLEKGQNIVVRGTLSHEHKRDLWIRIRAYNADTLCCNFEQERMNHEIQIV